jgi:hypothetical protein
LVVGLGYRVSEVPAAALAPEVTTSGLEGSETQPLALVVVTV